MAVILTEFQIRAKMDRKRWIDIEDDDLEILVDDINTDIDLGLRAIAFNLREKYDVELEIKS